MHVFARPMGSRALILFSAALNHGFIVPMSCGRKITCSTILAPAAHALPSSTHDQYPVTVTGQCFQRNRRPRRFRVCFSLDHKKSNGEDGILESEEREKEICCRDLMGERRRESKSQMREARKKVERRTYLIAAVISTLAITSMSILAVYYRFSWQMEGGEIPVVEMLGTFALSVGAAVGMELWARWAHRALWHASLWAMHESHHRAREGGLELNDAFAIMNAVPAISLISYGLFNKGLLPGLCFGAGLGITVFGMAYMFVHDGLVHRRFPVGPIANLPYLRTLAAAHQLHHSDKFDGVPYGLFLAPMELQEVGGMEELQKEINRRTK